MAVRRGEQKDINMSAYYADVNESGDIQGYLNDGIHDVIPDTAIEITEEQWQCALDINANRFINGEFSYIEPPPTTLTNDELLALRKTAYTYESDHLYMEWQFDETPASEQVWRDKVAEIKLRYPLTS